MPQALSAQLPVAIIFLCFVLFPFSRSVEFPVLIMTVSGIVIAFRQRTALWQLPAIRLFSLLALCIWIPMLLSFLGTYSVNKTAGTILVFFRLYFSGIFVIWVLQSRQRVGLLTKLLAGLAAFWVVDALIQAAMGRDILGFARNPQRLNGLFGETDWTLGIALPVLAPFLFLALRRKLAWMVLAFIATSVVVALSGSRGGWISYAVVCAMVLLYEARQRAISLWKLGAVATLVAAVGVVAVFQLPGTQARLAQTMLLFSGEEAAIDRALSNRWTLWQATARMIEAHPVNGVGVRAFRFAYPDYAEPGDLMVNPDKKTGRITGAAYAHQIVLEVLSETGLIGLAGLLIFYTALVRAWVNADSDAQNIAVPFALAALAWLFPINTHTAFYSSQWSQLIWLLLALYCASLLNRLSHTQAPRL